MIKGVALQTFSLRGWASISQTFYITKQLGFSRVEMHWWLANCRNVQPRIDDVAKGFGVSIVSWGVPHISADRFGMEQIFAFALALGLKDISVDLLTPDLVWVVGDIAEKTDIRVGIHPHGPGATFPGWKAVWDATVGASPYVGLCLDTGHTIRAGEDVFEAVETVGDRLFSVHLKDVDEHGRDCSLGEGTLRLRDFIACLKANNFGGWIFLEHEAESHAETDLMLWRTQVERLIGG